MKSTSEIIKSVLIACVSILTIFLSVSISTQKIVDVNERIDSLQMRIKYLEQIKPLSVDSIFNLDWFLFKLTITDVESNHNVLAVNINSEAADLYQIMPVYIAESNRLQKNIVFTDTCVFDPLLSTQMFEIINNYWNPDKDINVSIKLHNPTEVQGWYKERVLKKYELYKSLSFSL